MHEPHRKQPVCTNCHHPLEAADNFCPRCGQENTTRVVSFGTLVYEAVSDFISWDSRWFQTVVPFLFRPGHLTNEFVAGRRVRYMPPLRLYFFISLICFSIIAYYTARENKQDEQKETVQKNIQADSIRQAVLRDLPQTITTEQRQKIQDALQKLTLQEATKGLINTGSAGNNNTDTTTKTSKKKKKRKKRTITISTDTTQRKTKAGVDEDPDKSNEFTLLLRLVQNPALSEEAILDSLHWENNYWNRMKVNRARRFKNGKRDEFLAGIWDKAPFSMFLLLPFMALIMKLLYIRRNRLYIEHLIFMLHIHAFIFFLIALDIVLDNEFANLNPSFIVVPLILVYLWIAFYKVYRQGWLRTTFKLFSFLFLYTFIFSFVAVFALLIVAATF